MKEGKREKNNIFNSTELVGNSAFCRMIREQVPTMATSDLPVLILGASGTGKDLIARMIHAASRRADKPYLSLNCATLGTLAESELFGHVTGAFTGAVRGTHGYLGSANGGTLLLDEVGELSLEIQAKLLRFLDGGDYFRVGESTPRFADIRVIAATNQDLETLVREKCFREDLYYRLCGFLIKTEPLSERTKDIPQLVRHFTRIYAQHFDQEEPFITPEAMNILASWSWPGNVRQLKYAVFKLCHFAREGSITPELIIEFDLKIYDSPNKTHSPSIDCKLDQYKIAKEKAIAEFDRRYFTTLLETTRGNLKETLTISGLHKKNFYLKIKNLGLNPKDFKKEPK
ncbi:MAG: sigma-54-dependent Fis family transcriptional regulator [Deltaproteobacteria bacterium]|nr:sigma-54-dependent Fis family transcriptional regulator [Deltaproteobacteria bacterium]